MTWTPLHKVPREQHNPDVHAMHAATGTMPPDEVWVSPATRPERPPPLRVPPHKGRQRPWEKGLTTGGVR